MGLVCSEEDCCCSREEGLFTLRGGDWFLSRVRGLGCMDGDVRACWAWCWAVLGCDECECRVLHARGAPYVRVPWARSGRRASCVA